MDAIPDYLSDCGAQVRREADGSRVTFATQSARYFDVDPSEVAHQLNIATHFAASWYLGNLKRRGTFVASSRVCAVALSVAISTLCMFNKCFKKLQIQEFRDRTITEADLSNTLTVNLCVAACKEQFGRDYAHYAAAMNDMSFEQFQIFEERDERFHNR